MTLNSLMTSWQPKTSLAFNIKASFVKGKKSIATISIDIYTNTFVKNFTHIPEHVLSFQKVSKKSSRCKCQCLWWWCMVWHKLISTSQTYNPQSVSFHGLVLHEIVNPVLPERSGIVHVRKIRKDGETRPNLKTRNLQALK